MYGTCLTSDTFHIPTFSQDASAASHPAQPAQSAPAPAAVPAPLSLYRELSAISQEIESCRQNY